MESVTLSRMRRGGLVLAAAAVMVGIRMFSAAPAMAEPLVITEPAQPLVITEPVEPFLNETIFDNGFFVSFDHDVDHDAKADHDSDHDAKADHDSGHNAKADRR